MAAGVQTGCNNHPSIQAVGRCKQCGKPFCGSCQVQGPTGNFCATECKDRHEEFTRRASKLDDMSSTSGFLGKLMARVKKLVVFSIAILVIAVVLHYLNVNVPIVSDFLVNL